MSLWKIAWRSIQQRALSSWLTGLSMALGVALVVAVLVIHGVIARSFSEAAQGYHLIVGAKGGKLQLVMNTVFHLSEPIENIPWSFYKQFIQYKDEQGNLVSGAYASTVEVAVPYCLGDSYQNFRVVGTTPDLFDKLSYGANPDGTLKNYRFAQGQNFDVDDYRAAVIGSVAAAQTGLKLGDKFPITHGLADDENAHVHEEDLFHVVGVLAPTGTPNDRAVFVNLQGFLLISGHDKPIPKKKEKQEEKHDHEAAVEELQSARDELRQAAETENVPRAAVEHIQRADEIVENVIADAKGNDVAEDHADEHEKDHADDHAETASHNHDEHEHGHDHSGKLQPLPEAQREVTAILVLMKNDQFAQLMEGVINDGNVAQAVFPTREVDRLFAGIVGPMQLILLVLAVLVIVVASIGVMVSIYNSMSDRSREIAIMRALGAGRQTVMVVVLLESILLSLLGGVAGVLIGHTAIGVLSGEIVSQTGISIGFLQFEMIELVLIPALVVLASLVGYLPALAAYRTDVAKALSAAP
jgi:putative ABC transport system permease protein